MSAKKSPRTISKPGTYARKCHDCGKPTSDYRCPACLRAWREEHRVSKADVENWLEDE